MTKSTLKPKTCSFPHPTSFKEFYTQVRDIMFMYKVCNLSKPDTFMADAAAAATINAFNANS